MQQPTSDVGVKLIIHLRLPVFAFAFERGERLQQIAKCRMLLKKSREFFTSILKL
jgi:hypothetical protein